MEALRGLESWRAKLAKRKTTGVGEATLSDQVAEYVGKSLSKLLTDAIRCLGRWLPSTPR